MTDIEEILTQDFNFAIEEAKATNRFEVADYLTLRASNDAIRKECTKWLFDRVLEIVIAFNKHGAKIKLTQKEKHNFSFGNANLRGQLLKLQQGVRCLEIEVGWTRTPSDGFMRGGALACARISNFGFSKRDEELVLLKFDNRPQWFSVAEDNHRISFNVQSLRKHFETFLGDKL